MAGRPAQFRWHQTAPAARSPDASIHTICALAKLVRGEDKDIEFVDALVEAGLIDPSSLVRICMKLPLSDARRAIAIKRAQAFLPK